jgi:hypothetical protein
MNININNYEKVYILLGPLFSPSFIAFGNFLRKHLQGQISQSIPIKREASPVLTLRSIEMRNV